MHEFLSTWYGMTIFIAFDVLAGIALIAICYRFFFKRLFDILFSAVCLILTSPVFLWVYLKYRTYKKSGGEVSGFLRRDPAVGKRGETVAMTTFQTLAPDGSVAGEYGKGMQERKVRKLPRLLDVFWGRATFIGVSPVCFADAAFLDEEGELRYESRIGLISPIPEEKKQGLPEDWLDAESRYAHGYTLFWDIKVFFGWLLKTIRGEKAEEAVLGYAKSLAERAIISKEEYESVLESAAEEEKEFYAPQNKGTV
ncbi:MAG: sugar transferase [Clostridia bacterium]|nr:sugar transferase [Clostridia bacterium]